ncbi:MAG: cyclase dehydrase [Rhodomicrobium sp.]
MLMIEAASKLMNNMPRSRKHSARHLAYRLGWFSIGLGMLEILAPHRLSRLLGSRGGELLVGFFGLREIATGVAILSAKDPEPFVWGRVAGDAADLAALAASFMASRRKPLVRLALGSVAMITVIDVICAQTLSAGAARKAGRIPDYSDRSGLPKMAAQMRGAARDAAARSGVTLQ